MSNSNKMINIGGSPEDPHYRYKRHQIQIKHTNKKGGETTIINLVQISKELKLPFKVFEPKFLKKVKKKYGLSAKNGKFKGSVTVNQLEKVLEQFIKKHILCPSPTCGLPEWNGEQCSACGHQREEKGGEKGEKEKR